MPPRGSPAARGDRPEAVPIRARTPNSRPPPWRTIMRPSLEDPPGAARRWAPGQRRAGSWSLCPLTETPPGRHESPPPPSATPSGCTSPCLRWTARWCWTSSSSRECAVEGAPRGQEESAPSARPRSDGRGREAARARARASRITYMSPPPPPLPLYRPSPPGDEEGRGRRRGGQGRAHDPPRRCPRPPPRPRGTCVAPRAGARGDEVAGVKPERPRSVRPPRLATFAEGPAAARGGRAAGFKAGRRPILESGVESLPARTRRTPASPLPRFREPPGAGRGRARPPSPPAATRRPQAKHVAVPARCPVDVGTNTRARALRPTSQEWRTIASGRRASTARAAPARSSAH